MRHRARLASGFIAPAVLAIAMLLFPTYPAAISWLFVLFTYALAQMMFWLAMLMTRLLRRDSTVLAKFPAVVLVAMSMAILSFVGYMATAVIDGSGLDAPYMLRDTAVLSIAGAATFGLYVALTRWFSRLEGTSGA